MKIYTIAFMLLMGTLSASAQIERKPVTLKKDSVNVVSDQTNADNDKQKRKEKIRELDLTREQRGKMKEIMQSGKATKEAIENNAQLSDQEKKKQLREFKQTQAQKVQAILTPEQLAKFKANRQDKP